ncbi:MAG: G8 domain-containing protein, partial [Betaproteobacteria bacterium]
MPSTLRSLILLAALLSAGAATRDSLAQLPESCSQTDNTIKTFTPLSQCVVPGPERNVVIGGGDSRDPCKNVYIDKNYINAEKLGKIDIKSGGGLYARDTTSTIEATSIIVAGTFQAGTEACPVGKLAATNKFTVRLLGAKPPVAPANVHVHDASVVCSDVPKGIGVMAGGSLRLYGARGIAPANRDSSGIGPNLGSVSWSYLARPAGPDEYQTSLKNIKAPVALGDGLQIAVPLDVTKDWLKGDWIAVGTTSYSPYETEFVQISTAADAVTYSSTTKLSTIKLDATTPLRHYHFGGPDPQRPGAANAAASEATNYGVDERASVALISRSITLTAKMVPWESTAAPDKDSLAWGGETRLCQGFTEAKFQGVELDRFGKDQLGSYPLHLHMAETLTATQFLFNSNSVHHSYNHCLTVHQTNNAKFSNNTCARIVGHMFYQEKMKDIPPTPPDGGTNIQLKNIAYTDNLGLGAMANGFKIAAGVPVVKIPPVTGKDVPKNWWEGDYFARLGDGYSGLGVPNTDDRSLAVRGSCFAVETVGSFVGSLISAKDVQADLQCPPAFPVYFEPPTGFWIVNPATVMIGNSMGGCQSIGKAFWYVPPAGQDSSFQLKFQPVGKFINNRAHSCYDGVFGETDTGIKSEQLFPKVDGDNTKKNLVAKFDGFTAFRIRNRGIWMRPVWFVFENARVATSREGVSLVTSGGLDGNAPGVWGLLKDSTVVGVSKNNVDRWGPCGNQNKQEGPGCVDWNSQSNTIFDKGYASPAWNFAGFYIYDGPVRIHDVRFVNYKIDPKPLLTTDDVAIQGAFTQWLARGQTVYEGDAALGWFANNQSAYPVATEVKGLKWENVDLRHQVFTDLVNFGNFDDGDKNTAVIDRDGTLTGFAIADANGKFWDPLTNPNSTAHEQFPISLNNLPFNSASNAVDECNALGAQDKISEQGRPTSLISPANYGTLEFEAFTLPDGRVPLPPPPGEKDTRKLTQFVTFTRDVLDYGKHQTMQLHSRNNQGIWEPKVVSGLGYTITAQDSAAKYPEASRAPG